MSVWGWGYPLAFHPNAEGGIDLWDLSVVMLNLFQHPLNYSEIPEWVR
jgi:hypothetical protein